MDSSMQTFQSPFCSQGQYVRCIHPNVIWQIMGSRHFLFHNEKVDYINRKGLKQLGWYSRSIYTSRGCDFTHGFLSALFTLLKRKKMLHWRPETHKPVLRPHITQPEDPFSRGQFQYVKILTWLQSLGKQNKRNHIIKVEGWIIK